MFHFRKQGENTYLEESSCGSTIMDTKCDIRNIEYYTKYFVKVDTVLTTERGPESDVKYIIIPPGSKFQLITYCNSRDISEINIYTCMSSSKLQHFNMYCQ